MEITITSAEANQRIDKFVRRWIKEAPLSFIYKLFRQKDVKVNGKKAKIDYILQDGDRIDIYLKPQLLDKFKKDYVIRPVKAKLDILYEDTNILVVNKPAGLIVQSDGDTRMTLASIFLEYLKEKGEFDPTKSFGFLPGPAHRLDRNTSGVVICGKNLMAIQELLRLFRERDQIDKTYIALVKGQIDEEGRIDIPLKKDPERGMVYKSTLKQGGKTAITEYQRIKAYSDFSLVKVHLLTGRTHQIRAHFAFISHPVVGDGKYGDFKVNKEFDDLYGLHYQFLHAASFSFLNPSGPLSYLSGRTFEAPLPAKLKEILDQLG